MNDKLTKDKALQKDKEFGFFSEFDAETLYFGVFGLETGCMYSMHENKEQADFYANELNQKYNLVV